MTPILCTLFDKKYLAKGLALIRSLQCHHAHFELTVLALDDMTAEWVRQLKDPRVKILPLTTLEDSDLLQVKLTRTLTEYYWTLTPFLIEYILRMHQPPNLAYIDADCYLYAPLDPLYQEVAKHTLGIIPHRFSQPLVWRATHNGTYNVSWVYFLNNPQGRVAATVWAGQCLEWCYQKTERDAQGRLLFGDQAYLDAWPATFDTYVIQNIGANLAPWNQFNYRYCFDNWLYVIQHQNNSLDPAIPIERIDRLIFYHFHELQWRGGRKGGAFARGGHALQKEIIERLYLPYENELVQHSESLAFA